MVNRLFITILLILTISSCSSISPLGLLTGGGTNVAANTQVGKENVQTVGVNKTVRPVVNTEGPVDTVIQDTSTTTNVNVEPWVILLLILGWLAPSPSEIARSITNLIKRK